ncbi:hypothetical protein BKP35_01520 [Anaerobacillus arseniciselenatis]|uniref:Uncharacterized protein n=1 Tax=Anaerobacillus arseniciselenatis TaxID=85682 RepID=A0A1S2LT26_9BACI|nr:hypothetical protein [Anaerobacillus arseniciselenatis]OIJ15699.1 hypothetical protein BKP35_01520 [Anaerobacillus arseniciselenatis]
MMKYKIPFFSSGNKTRMSTATVIDQEEKMLDDGRMIKIQKWKESNYIFITYFFSMEELEEKSKEELYNYLVAKGVMINQPYSKGRVTCQKFLDENKQQCWGLTVIADRAEVEN